MDQTLSSIDEEKVMAIVVCNKGTADAADAVLDLYYKASLSKTKLDAFATGPVSVGNCTNVPLSIDPKQLAYIRKHYAEKEEVLYAHIEKTQPEEYATQDNFAYIESENLNFPLTKEMTHTLHEGWNLMALPLNKGALSLKNLHGIEKIWTYDLFTGWTESAVLYPGKGYWVKVSMPVQIEVYGQEYMPDYRNLTSGWHLLGTGSVIHNLHEEDSIGYVWVWRDGIWLQNPYAIQPAEAFWLQVR